MNEISKLVQKIEENPNIKRVVVDDIDLAKAMLLEKAPKSIKCVNFLAFRANPDIYTIPPYFHKKQLRERVIENEKILNKLKSTKYWDISTLGEESYTAKSEDIETAVKLTKSSENLPEETEVTYKIEKFNILGIYKKIVEEKEKKCTLVDVDPVAIYARAFRSMFNLLIPSNEEENKTAEFRRDERDMIYYHSASQDQYIGKFWAGIFATKNTPLDYACKLNNGDYINKGEGGFGGSLYEVPRIVVYHPRGKDMPLSEAVAFVEKDNLNIKTD